MSKKRKAKALQMKEQEIWLLIEKEIENGSKGRSDFFFKLGIDVSEIKEILIESIPTIDDSGELIISRFVKKDKFGIIENTLGLCFADENNETEAFKWFLKAAEKGLLISQNEVGWRLFNGKGVEPNKNEAIKWLEKASLHNQPEALNNLACLDERSDPVRSFDLLKRACENGCDAAYMNLGDRYLKGLGIEKNEKQAFDCYIKASNETYPIELVKQTANRLGQCYDLGIGCEKNEKCAFQWHLKAAELKHPDSSQFVFKCYLYGKGTKQNSRKALHFYDHYSEIIKPEIQNVLNLNDRLEIKLIIFGSFPSFPLVMNLVDIALEYHNLF